MKPYFSHDEGARNDPKLVQVMMDLGHEGKSVYWDLVEMLYEQGGYLMLAQCKGYAFALRTSCDLILKLVNDFGLFVNDGEKFWSETALERMSMRASKSERRAAAGAKGGKAKAEREAAAKAFAEQSHSNATAVPQQSLAIKTKEIKENTAVAVGEQADGNSSAVEIPAHPTEQKGGGPREFYYDEAPVFQLNVFFAFVDSIGYKHVDKGMYLVQIQAVGREKMIHTTDEKWRAFIRSWLNNDKRDGKLLLPVAEGQQQPHNPQQRITGNPTNLVAVGDLNARAEAQKTKSFL